MLTTDLWNSELRKSREWGDEKTFISKNTFQFPKVHLFRDVSQFTDVPWYSFTYNNKPPQTTSFLSKIYFPVHSSLWQASIPLAHIHTSLHISAPQSRGNRQPEGNWHQPGPGKGSPIVTHVHRQVNTDTSSHKHQQSFFFFYHCVCSEYRLQNPDETVMTQFPWANRTDAICQ